AFFRRAAGASTARNGSRAGFPTPEKFHLARYCCSRSRYLREALAGQWCDSLAFAASRPVVCPNPRPTQILRNCLPLAKHHLARPEPLQRLISTDAPVTL